MTVERHQALIQGLSLHRLVLRPESEPRGGLVFFHGQGDFIDRYPPLLEGFVKAGYQCLLTDLPGHGRSPGKRGHIPGLDFIDDLLADSLKVLKGPVIIAGHSMGGLMALRLFLLHRDRFQAAWFNSPLLKILDHTNPLLARLLPLASKLFPRLTVGTGVTNEQCGDFSEEKRSDNPDEEVLYHSRISLGWGHQLCHASDFVWDQMVTCPAGKPVLFTQGDEDPVCPTGALYELLEKPDTNHLDLKIIPGARHEPFSGSTRDTFLETLNSWIEKKIAIPKKPVT